MVGGRGDRGQAFPIYIVLVAGLLFAALAFFVVGMAGATRSNAQGAADAAALAAAREVRDNAFLGLDLPSLSPTAWEELVKGDLLNAKGACSKATEFAALNDASVSECEVAIPRFSVAVSTKGTVGKSVVPGSEALHGKATAKALIEPRCFLKSTPIPAPTPTSTASPAPTASPSPSAGLGSVAFVCKGKTLTLDLEKPGSLGRLARSLFSVRLAD
ncbi:pilus assembly protein TadG-related protein [Streptomyces sp. NPDC004244]